MKEYMYNHSLSVRFLDKPDVSGYFRLNACLPSFSLSTMSKHIMFVFICNGLLDQGDDRPS